MANYGSVEINKRVARPNRFMKASHAKRPLSSDRNAAAAPPFETLQRPTAKETAGTQMKLQRILVPTDFSRESAKAVRYAVSMARQFDASITLVHVVEPSYGPADLGGTHVARKSSENRRTSQAKSKLGLLGRRILGPCRIVETVIRNGLAFFEITEAAKALSADLIIIGTHGYCGLTRAIIGSTAEKVVRHAPCPVLVVRRHEHEFIE
jgi:nucleotide-binding universal stress UspA family protein